MRALLVVLAAGCGRIGFATTDGTTTGDGGTDSTRDAAATDIVRGGLALDLDPGDPASYPGTGPKIVDLSPFHNDGQIAGAPVFSANGAGSYFTFDGGDAQYIDLGSATPAGWTFARAARTLSGWVLLATNRPGYSVFFSYGTGADGQGSYLGTSSDGSRWNFGGFYINQLGSPTFTGRWVMVTGVWDGSVAQLYLDGVLSTESPQPIWNAIPGNTAKLGVDTAFPGEGWNGRLGRMLYYTRALTPAEVLHNYDVTRARY